MAKEKKAKKTTKKKAVKKKTTKTSGLRFGPKGPRKRPISEQDFEDFESLARMQCTLGEICGFFKCSLETLQNRLRNHYDRNDYSTIYNDLRAEGMSSLRRAMFEQALKGDSQMMRWLSRQYLNMSDKVILSNGNSQPDDNRILEPAERLKLIHGEKQQKA